MTRLPAAGRAVFDPARLDAAMRETLVSLPRAARGLCVAYSGGLDSTVLLAALARLRGAASLPLRAVHVDHGLQEASRDWARCCELAAVELGVTCRLLRVDARPPRGASPEAWARRLRREALAAELGVDELLLTAHHADDQFETVLLQLLRGGGPAGIAAMPRVACFGPGWQVRPLLGFTRDALQSWAVGTGLSWTEDPSNLDLRLDRNYLRHEVLPVLRRRWPRAALTVGQAAALTAEALELAALIADSDLAGVREGRTVRLAALLQLPESRQRAVLRAWLAASGLPLPSVRALAALRRDLADAGPDRIPCARWQDARVYRYRGRLYAEHAPSGQPVLAGRIRTTDDTAADVVAGIGLSPVVGRGLSRARLPGSVELRPRRGGELFRPAHTQHRRPLRKWLQERGVLPWQRDHIPLLYAGEVLVAVGDLGYDAGFAAAADEPGLELRWPARPVLTEDEARGLPGA